MRSIIAATVISGIVAGTAAIAASPGPSSSPGSLDCYNGFEGTPIAGGVRVTCTPDAPIVTTTTTPPPPTTDAPPTTTTPPDTTAPPTTEPPPPSTTTPPAPTGGFVEAFDGGTGLERFDYGVYHRPDGTPGGTVLADHDLACGPPDTFRTVDAGIPSQSFYVCRDHLMTAVGDFSAYSIAWFEPAQTFVRGDVTTISWDVNVTDLGQRQWWEVIVVPASYTSGIADCPHCATVSWVAEVANVPALPPGSVAVGNGPLGNDVSVWHDGGQVDDFAGTCNAGHSFDWFDPYCDDKATRVTFSITDNLDGTLTVDYGSSHGGFVETFPGQLPDSFRAVFKDHNYTPSKDHPGLDRFTWHWDNIVVS